MHTFTVSWSNFGLLAKFKDEAACLKQQLSQALCSASDGQTARQELQRLLAASQAESADLRLQLSQVRLVQVRSKMLYS